MPRASVQSHTQTETAAVPGEGAARARAARRGRELGKGRTQRGGGSSHAALRPRGRSPRRVRGDRARAGVLHPERLRASPPPLISLSRRRTDRSSGRCPRVCVCVCAPAPDSFERCARCSCRVVTPHGDHRLIGGGPLLHHARQLQRRLSGRARRLPGRLRRRVRALLG
jgi:hypothetical protein